MDYLFQGYNKLKGPKGQEQQGEDTIIKLCDQLNNCTLVEDRRAAILSLKGLARDWKLVSFFHLIAKACWNKGYPCYYKDAGQG
jgi:hypothetical protein